MQRHNKTKDIVAIVTKYHGIKMMRLTLGMKHLKNNNKRTKQLCFQLVHYELKQWLPKLFQRVQGKSCRQEWWVWGIGGAFDSWL